MHLLVPIGVPRANVNVESCLDQSAGQSSAEITAAQDGQSFLAVVGLATILTDVNFTAHATA